MKLLEIANNDELMEIGRKAIEDSLISLRDSRTSLLRNNGLVCFEKDGKPSSIIRLGPEHAVRIALEAIATHLKENSQ